MSDLLHFASEYARAGMAVFPCKIDKSPYVNNGFKVATTDEETIKKWWSTWPDANIGIATGQRSGGIFVVDQDEKNGEHGVQSFEDWREDNHLWWGKTWEVSTPSGGKHTYFMSSEPVRGRVHWLPGVDVRGDGNYVLAPPSRGPAGAYEWIRGPWDGIEWPESDNRSDISVMIDEINSKASSSEAFTAPKKITEGGRNDTLYKLACSLQAKGLSDSAIMAAVKSENEAKCEPPLLNDEIERIVGSALGWEKGPQLDATSGLDDKTLGKLDFPIQPLRSVRQLMEEDDDPLVVYVGDEKTPLLSEGTTVLAAPPKLGKSWFCLNLCQALHDGTSFLGLPTKKTHVVYYDLEQSKRLERKRIRQMAGELGIVYPDGFYIMDKLQRISHGLTEQMEANLQEDPEIGVFIVDVFANVEQPRRTTETEYQWTYKNFNVINELAKKHHVAVILVMHTRKVRDKEHPFDNILGSSANQGAANHMILLDKERYNLPVVHLYAQGRETEGVIEMDYSNDGGVLNLTEVQPEELDELQEFMESEIRNSVVKFMETTVKWKGRCSSLIEECARLGIGMDAGPLDIGKFLSKNVGKFMKHDDIHVSIIKNGSGAKLYALSKEPLITVDDEWTTVDDTPFKLA